MYKLTAELKKKIQEELNSHFGVEVSIPKILVVHDPNKFFDFYTGDKKKRSLAKLIALDTEVSYFYDDLTKSIIFKGFRRDGEKSFCKIKTQPMFIGDIVHEWIHHIQTMTNGYGNTNVFAEGCNEICRYVIVGDIDTNGKAKYNVYWPYIQYVWTIMSASADSPSEIYELIRDWNMSENKAELEDQYLNAFLKMYPKLAGSKKTLVNVVNDLSAELTPYQKKILLGQNPDEIVDELYSLHEEYGEHIIDLIR